MIFAVIGSRDFNDYSLLKSELSKFNITEIVSGGARGADSLAEQYAKEYKIPVKVFPADWNRLGKRAGYIRNEDVVNYSEYVIAFWDGKSKGTLHSIKLAKSKNKKLFVIKYLDNYGLF